MGPDDPALREEDEPRVAIREDLAKASQQRAHRPPILAAQRIRRVTCEPPALHRLGRSTTKSHTAAHTASSIVATQHYVAPAEMLDQQS